MPGNSIHWGQACRGRLSATDPWAALRSEAERFLPRLQTEVSAGRLPFVNLPYRGALEAELPLIMQRCAQGKKHLLLLGIGGSAVGPRALQKAFMPQQDWPGHSGPWLWIADNVDAALLEAWLQRLPAQETLLLVVSKSGGTIETMAQYFIVREWLQKELGADWSKSVLAVTDEKSGALRQEALEKGLATLPVPEHLGGRFSILSAVGLVPAYFCGLDWKSLLAGAAALLEPLAQNPASFVEHPAWRLALWAEGLLKQQYSQLIFFSYIPAWSAFGPWFAQLWAESLGKSGRGSMPLPATGVTDQHSLLQMFLDGPKDKACLFLDGGDLSPGPRFGTELPAQWGYLRGKSFGDVLEAESLGSLVAFAAQDIPLVRLSMGKSDAAAAGRLLALLELTTLLTGWLLDIDPLDQPAVEYGKRLAKARLGASGYSREEEDLQGYLAVPEQRQGF